jgi:excisionase family DNA binding protein
MNTPIDSEDDIEPRFVGVPQLVKAIGVSRSTVYEMLDDGRLKSVHVGRRRLVSVEELDRFADALKARAV